MMEMSRNNIKILLVAIILCFTGLCVRFGQLSIEKKVNNISLVEYGQYRNRRSSVVQVRRGSIFDVNGIPIALDATSYSLIAVLKSDWSDNYVKDPDMTATVLSKYIDMDRDEILEKLLSFGLYQVEFHELSGLSLETKKAIEMEKLPGIMLMSQPTRHYLNDYFASHLIGFASPVMENENMKSGVLVGQQGVEKAFNPQLNGGVVSYNEELTTNFTGDDITMTIDSRLQNPLEKLMDEYFQKYSPKALQLYLVDVSDGKLVSAAQRPTFNLNTRVGIDNLWTNLLIGEAYEPGSTIKTLTTAVAYDRHVFTPYELFQSGSIQVYDQIVKDHNVQGWGAINFEEGFARSSNVAMVNLVQRMGEKVWTDKLLEFGFGETTNFFPNGEDEVTGMTNFESPVTSTMSGFGQGFSATPIQLLQAFSAIANNGEMLKIQVADKVGTQQYFQREILGNPVTSEAANYIMKLMIDTVEKPYGTAQAFKNPTMRVAAKTGTAQIASPDGNGYLKGENDYYHSAVVFFPAEAPKYMMYLSMKQPSITYGQIGSQILGELFNRFANIVMMYE